jgi:hypothetical protein
MNLITLGILILMIGVVISLAFKFFWIVSIVFLYRFISYFITFEWVKSSLGIENHTIYFILIIIISFATHYTIIRFTTDMEWIKILFFILVILWVLFKYDFLEIFMLKDWLLINNLWGVENIQVELKELFTTNPEEFKGYFTNALNKLNETINGIFNFVSNRKEV